MGVGGTGMQDPEGWDQGYGFMQGYEKRSEVLSREMARSLQCTFVKAPSPGCRVG